MARTMRSCALALVRSGAVAAALTFALLVPTAPVLTAQAAPAAASSSLPSVPRFPIAASPIGIVSDVRPKAYLGVTGPRSGWLGSETGVGEVWVYPLKVAREVQLSFKVPQYRTPLRGAEVASRVEVRPEATTITYSHMAFTVRQHIVAPRNEPGLLMLLDVETFVPLEVWVSFRPELQYMWPGSFGGQYTFFDAGRGAFLLSESLRQRNALIGTSWPAAGETLPSHFQADWPPTLVIQVDSARAAREFVPVAVVAGTLPRDSVYAAYERLLGNAQRVYEGSRAWADSVLAASTSVDTPDDELDLAVAWAKVNLEEQRVCNPDLGCGFVAGWGPSANSTRPGFGWFFGGDAAITSLAMDAAGQWDRVAEALRFLAAYQRADGKIAHEVSQSAKRIPWFTDFPYPYYHADTTPHWMVALWSYWRASGDDATVRALWPAYQKAWTWCLTAETDGDGIIENTVGGYGAIEVGGMGDALHQDIYLAAVWINALGATAELARHLGDGALAARADGLRAVALRTLNERYWRPGEDQHAFGILQGGGTNVNLSAWPGTALSYGLLEPTRAERTLRKLATDSISSDWGARLLSVGSPLYDPLHYNNGAVWPFMTGYVAWGQYRYRRPWAGYPLVDAVKQHAFDWGRGRFPENFSGSYYRPMDETVPHQFFATSMLLTPLLNGVLGWEPDAPRSRAMLAPQLPPEWDRVRVSRLRVGGTTLDVEVVQEPGRFQVAVAASGPPVELDVVLPVPPGAGDVRAAVSGVPGDAGEGTAAAAAAAGAAPSVRPARPVPVTGLHDLTLTRTLRLADGARASVEVSWTGGLQVAAPLVDLVPGQASSGVRVVDFKADSAGWLLELEGEAGRAYGVRIFGARPVVAAATGVTAEVLGARGPGSDVSAETSGRTLRDPAGAAPTSLGAARPDAHVLHVRFPDGAGRRLASLRLSPER